MTEKHDRDSDVAQEERGGPLRTFVGLFFVPLLVVLLCVAVFIGFGWIAYDHQTTQDYLNDLRSGWRPRRAQAAYELSKVLIADPDALDDSPGAKAELRALFEEAERGELKRYLALVLGYAKDREAVPLLIESLADPDSETRIYSVMALGTLGAPEAEGPLVELLRDEDAGLRKTAAYALGQLGQPTSIGALQPLLKDSVADVRWNAALAVTHLGSSAGVTVLFEMVDRNAMTKVPGITPSQVEEVMISGVGALGAAGSQEARPVLEDIAKSDPSLRVREAAMQALQGLSS